MKPVKTILLLLLISAVGTAQNVNGRILKRTSMQVGGYVTASCSSPACEASIPLVPPLKVICPAPAGNTCTISVQVSSSARASQGSTGIFRYTGDGGLIGASMNPDFLWQDYGNETAVPASFNFPIVVTNTTNFQLHKVEVDLVCRNSTGICSVSTAANSRYDVSTTVRTDVFVT
jgi:hypothetical protein